MQVLGANQKRGKVCWEALIQKWMMDISGTQKSLGLKVIYHGT